MATPCTPLVIRCWLLGMETGSARHGHILSMRKDDLWLARTPLRNRRDPADWETEGTADSDTRHFAMVRVKPEGRDLVVQL